MCLVGAQRKNVSINYSVPKHRIIKRTFLWFFFGKFLPGQDFLIRTKKQQSWEFGKRNPETIMREWIKKLGNEWREWLMKQSWDNG